MYEPVSNSLTVEFFSNDRNSITEFDMIYIMVVHFLFDCFPDYRFKLQCNIYHVVKKGSLLLLLLFKNIM